MSKNTKDNCYHQLVEQFTNIQKTVDSIQETVVNLLERYDADEELRAGCPDEIAADKAAYEAVREICLDSLLDVKPKGDA